MLHRAVHLGRLTLSGAVSPFVAAAAYLVPGLLIFSLPKGTTELYQVTAPVPPPRSA